MEFTANVDGQPQYVKVNSFRRVIDVTMECGSYVSLSTNLGEFKLDTTHLWHNGGTVEVIGTFTKGRKLSVKNLLAFYEDVDNIEFECTVSWEKKEGASPPLLQQRTNVIEFQFVVLCLLQRP